MRKIGLMVFSAMFAATAGVAHDTETAFSSRGACEATSASMSNAEQDWLVETFPQFFDTQGEASSFLTKAWTCDFNPATGEWYITDHIAETLGSSWFDRRNH